LAVLEAQLSQFTVVDPAEYVLSNSNANGPLPTVQ
jgi:hypothetical protein